MESTTNEKKKILVKECRSSNPSLVRLIEEIYDHVEHHPNQTDETMVEEIKKIVNRQVGGSQ